MTFEFLLSLTGFSQLLLTIMLVLSIILNIKLFKAFFSKNFDKYDYYAILFLFTFGVGVRLYFLDNSHANIFDEFLYIKNARQLAEYGYTIEVTRSIGWSYLMMIPMMLFGFTSYVGFALSITIGSATLSIFYLVLRLICNEKNTPFFASLIFSVLPFHIFWSTKIETNIASLFTLLGTLFLFLVFHKTKNITFLYCAIISVFYAITFRGENIPVLFLTTLIVGVFNYKTLLQAKKTLFEILLVSGVCLILIVPSCISLHIFTNSQSWTSQTSPNIGFFNILTNIKYFYKGIIDNSLLLYYDILSLVGFCYGLFLLYKNKASYALVTIFLTPFVSLTIVYNLVRLNYTAGVDRLYMEIYPIYALIYGLSLTFIWTFLDKIFHFEKRHQMCYTLLFFVFFLVTISNLFITQYPYVKDDYKYLQTSMSNAFHDDILDTSCVYIVFDEEYYTLGGDLKFTHTYDFISDSSLRENILQTSQCVIFIEDKYCFSDAQGEHFYGPDGYSSSYYCKVIKDTFSLKKEQSYSYEDIVFSFYRVPSVK